MCYDVLVVVLRGATFAFAFAWLLRLFGDWEWLSSKYAMGALILYASVLADLVLFMEALSCDPFPSLDRLLCYDVWRLAALARRRPACKIGSSCGPELKCALVPEVDDAALLKLSC